MTANQPRKKSARSRSSCTDYPEVRRVFARLRRSTRMPRKARSNLARQLIVACSRSATRMRMMRELVAAVIALVGFLVHRAPDDAVERCRHRAAMRRGRRRLVLRDLVDHAELVGGLERQLAREQLVHHHAERIEIGAVVDQLL